jgi:hypothetical protein
MHKYVQLSSFMNNCYIVAGPGRTGSSLIAAELGQALGVPVLTDSTINRITADCCVVHTHNPRLQLDPDACVIVSHRRNLFDTIVSSCIASHYNEWTVYTSDQTPFQVALDDFENRYIWTKRWYEAFDTYTQYNNKTTVEYEKFIADYAGTNTKSPRDGKTVITNYHTLVEFFKELECNEFINTAPIDTFQWNYNE